MAQHTTSADSVDSNTVVVASIETANRSIIKGRSYRVVGIEEEDYRVVNERNDPILYPKTMFENSDIQPPETWVANTYDDEVDYHPAELSEKYFFSSFHDGEEKAVRRYREFCEKHKIGFPE